MLCMQHIDQGRNNSLRIGNLKLGKMNAVKNYDPKGLIDAHLKEIFK